MREILLTSSVLILALLALRRLFRKKISRRVQYALWGLVLVRLLIPVSLPALDFSVLTMTEPVRESISARLEAPAFTAPVVPVQAPQPIPSGTAKPIVPSTVPTPQQVPVPAAASAAPKQLTLTDILGGVWLAGAAVMFIWLLESNLRFAAKLRRERVRVEVPGCSRSVYMVKSGLASPCLFGILRPAVYLTPSAVTSEESLRHVLAHEETHARHLDPLWSLLRGVCLTVYWFDPLVWIAASAAKTDCELACDEGAIRRLGEGERIAYGRTLLSLVPVRRMPGNPLLSATTMSSDKKRLRDRVSRIAENRKTRKLALCAMALLTALACVFTFAGCSEQSGKPDQEPAAEPSPAPIAAKVEKLDGPLTAAELRYFNENFFNGNYMNIRNQFLSSVYETAADIDLFELFYNGTGQSESMTDQEWDAYEAEGGFVDTDVTKLSAVSANAVLRDYTGLILSQTSQVNLDHFIYLPEYDAYYFGHGDTNYRGQVDIAAGEREGDLLHLYYDDAAVAGGWKRVTLRETEDGYQFVSNQYSEKPAVRPVYPSGEPLLTLPLDDTRTSCPYLDHANMIRRAGDCEEILTGPGKSVMVGGRQIITYRSVEGYVCVAEVLDDGADGGSWKVRKIHQGYDDDAFYLESFEDVLGWQGISLHYNFSVEEAYQTYHGVDENGDWYDLIHIPGYAMDCRSIDLDGDGMNELLCTDNVRNAVLVFRRGDKIYSENISELLRAALPEGASFTFNGIDPYARCLNVALSVTSTGDSGAQYDAAAFRSIYYDGKDLQVYKPDKTAVDHITPGVTGPEDVMAVVGQNVREQAAAAQGDDWRITGLAGPWYEFFEGMTVEVYQYNYEYHTAAPENVSLAGGRYVDEDGWVSPAYPGCDYAYFRLEADGTRTFLRFAVSNDAAPGDETFRADLERTLNAMGVLDQEPGALVQVVWDALAAEGTLDLSLRLPTGEETSYALSALSGNQPWSLTYGYSWEALEDAPGGLGRAASLTVSRGGRSLTFYEEPQLVCVRNAEQTDWYRVSYTGQDDPYGCEMFEYFRRWFDEVESAALHDLVEVPNDGRSHLEIAQAWADAYEKVSLDLTSGSKLRCTYAEARDVELVMDVPRENYPASLKDRGVLQVRYSPVFVPEGEPHWFMAGNTAAYEGGDAPAGALQQWRFAYLYFDGGVWRCDSIGTGP